MAKDSSRDNSRAEDILRAISRGEISPLYLLMGEEPYYSDIISEEIIKNALAPSERDFNLITVYGSDTSAVKIIEQARRYPMMAPRQVVIVREAQMIDDIKELEHYFKNPFPSTVLVISLTGKSLDKRGTLYKTALEKATVLDSVKLKEYQLISWTEGYVSKHGKKIETDAAVMLSEHCGSELRKVVKELDKLLTHLSEKETFITTLSVEENTGISREYNAFELVRAVFSGDSRKAQKIAAHFGKYSKQYPNVLTFAALFSQFSRLLRYHAVTMGGKKLGRGELLKATGTWESALRELESAAGKYPPVRCMEVISTIRKYDSMSKSGARGEASDGELLMELVFRIIHQGPTTLTTLG